MYENELYHYGVKGMRWGHRKAQPVSSARNRMNTAKTEYKSAKKAYNKSFNRAYRKSLASFSPSKKMRQRNNARWEQAINDAERASSAKSKYKQAKKAYKQTDEYKAKRAKYIKTGAAVAGTALAVYGAYKLNKYVKSTNFKYHEEIGKRKASEYLDKFSKASSKATDAAGKRVMENYNAHPSSVARANLQNKINRVHSNTNIRSGAENIARFNLGERNSAYLRGYEGDLLDKTEALGKKLTDKSRQIITKETDKARTEGFATAARNTYKYRKKYRH